MVSTSGRSVGGLSQAAFLAYGAAHFGKSLFWQASEILFAFFLTEVCGVSPARMGIILSVSLLFNASADLCVGSWLAPRVTTLAAAGRAQAWGAWICAPAFALFGAMALFPEPARPLVGFASVAIFRMTYAFLDIPQNAVLALGTRTERDRTRLSAFRFMWGGAASLMIAASWIPAFTLWHRTWAYATFSGAAAAVALASAALLKALLQRQTSGARTQAKAASDTPLKSGRVGLLFILIFAAAISGSLFVRTQPYLVTYSLQGSRSAWLMTSVALGTIASQPLWSQVSRHLSLARTLQLASGIMAASSTMLAAPGLNNVDLTLAAGSLWAIGAGGMNMALWSMAGNAEVRGMGPMVTFGIVTSIAKLGSAAAALVLGYLLSNFDYRLSGHSELLCTMMATGSILCGALCIVCAPTLVSRNRFHHQPERSSHRC